MFIFCEVWPTLSQTNSGIPSEENVDGDFEDFETGVVHIVSRTDDIFI